MVEVPERAKLAFACAGIFLSFSYFAVLQEDVYKKPYGAASYADTYGPASYAHQPPACCTYLRRRAAGPRAPRTVRTPCAYQPRMGRTHRAPWHAPGTVWCTAGGEYFKYTFLALVCERGINAAIGAMGVLCLGGSGLKIPLLDILWSGTSQMFAMAGSNPHAQPQP